jgi:hypothetical protein
MTVGLAKIGASLGLAAALALTPVIQRVQMDRPSVLYAVAYVQALLGHTESAVRIAQQAATTESGNSSHLPAASCLF